MKEEEEIDQWSNFLDLISEAKEFLLKAELGEMCLDKLRNLSDRGMEIMKLAEDKKLQFIMLDINLMDTLFKIIQLNVRTLSPDKFHFDPVIHANKILNYYDTNKENRQLGQLLVTHLALVASRVFRNRACSLSVISGALEITEPQKKVRVAKPRLPKDKVEPQKEAEKVDKMSGLTVNATVVEIGKQLEKAYIANKKAAICYMKFVVHPTSFAKTVENIFHVSFLVNNTEAVIFLDKDDNPWIKPVPKDDHTKSRDNKCALVVGMNQDEWKEAVRLFEIKEPMIVLKDVEIPKIAQRNQKRKKPVA